MSAPTSETLASTAVEVLRSQEEELYPGLPSVTVGIPDYLEGNIVTALDMLRERPQPLLHVGRNPDHSIAITRGVGELGGGIWSVRVKKGSEVTEVELRIKNMSGYILTADGLVAPSFREERQIKDDSIGLKIGRNVIVEGEYSNDVPSAVEDLSWMMNPWERVLVVGNQALFWFDFGLTYSRQPKPEIARLLFGQLTKEEAEVRQASLA